VNYLKGGRSVASFIGGVVHLATTTDCNIDTRHTATFLLTKKKKMTDSLLREHGKAEFRQNALFQIVSLPNSYRSKHFSSRIFIQWLRLNDKQRQTEKAQSKSSRRHESFYPKK
jgi:hypothetical protein